LRDFQEPLGPSSMVVPPSMLGEYVLVSWGDVVCLVSSGMEIFLS
jgi:hypothetical protein